MAGAVYGRAPLILGLSLLSLGAMPIAQAADTSATTLGVRFRDIDQSDYRGCVLDFRVLAKAPPDFPDATLIVDGSLAYAKPRSSAPPRIGLSLIFSKEFKRSLLPLDQIYLAYLNTRNGSTGGSIADRVPNTPKTVASFAFGMDPTSERLLQDVRNGNGFTLMYRITANSDEHALPVDTRIGDSTFMGGKLIRYPSSQTISSFNSCIARLKRPDSSVAGRSEAEARDLSHDFSDWIRQYSPFPLYRSH